MMNDFEKFANFIHKHTGIFLKKEHQASMMSRLNPIFKAHADMNFAALANHVVLNPRSALSKKTIEAITINESSFFRDKIPFNAFEETMLPTLTSNERRTIGKQIKVWCAAASTGQEPYSLIMKWLDIKNRYPGWKMNVKGTDLNAEVIRQAQSGTYNQFEVQRGLPINLLVKYFKQDGDKWVINEALRSMVTFRECNLATPFTSMGTFDIIFCRNVLIYFNKETKMKILTQMHNMLAPDGFLILGSSETMIGIDAPFSPWERRPGVYRRQSQNTMPTSQPHDNKFGQASPLLRVANR